MKNFQNIEAAHALAQAIVNTIPEPFQHLKDAHRRVMLVAEMQRPLHISDGIDQIEVDSYLPKLCSNLASLMIGESQPLMIKVMADKGWIESGKAVSLGLIVTELVINAIKYAFPTNKPGALVLVTYAINGSDWKLKCRRRGRHK